MSYINASVVFVFADGRVIRTDGEMQVHEATVHDVVKSLAKELNMPDLLEWDYGAFIDGHPAQENTPIPAYLRTLKIRLSMPNPRKEGS